MCRNRKKMANATTPRPVAIIAIVGIAVTGCNTGASALVADVVTGPTVSAVGPAVSAGRSTEAGVGLYRSEKKKNPEEVVVRGFPPQRPDVIH